MSSMNTTMRRIAYILYDFITRRVTRSRDSAESNKPVVPPDCFLLKGPFFRIRQRKYYRAHPRSRVHGSLELAVVIFCVANTPQIALRIAAGADTISVLVIPSTRTRRILYGNAKQRDIARVTLCAGSCSFSRWEARSTIGWNDRQTRYPFESLRVYHGCYKLKKFEIILIREKKFYFWIGRRGSIEIIFISILLKSVTVIFLRRYFRHDFSAELNWSPCSFTG